MNPKIVMAVDLIVSASVGLIVSNVVTATTPENTKLLTRAIIRFGSVIVAAAVGKFASDYVQNEVEETVTDLQESIAAA